MSFSSFFSTHILPQKWPHEYPGLFPVNIVILYVNNYNIYSYIYHKFYKLINFICIYIIGRVQGVGSRSHNNDDDNEGAKTATNLDLNKDVTAYFLKNVSADQHYEGQTENRDRYVAGMAVLENNGVEIALSKLTIFEVDNGSECSTQEK